jgi:hypothetical protein
MKSRRGVLKRKLIEIIKTDIKEDISSALMKKYDERIIILENPDEPEIVSPSFCREEFKEFLEKSIEDSIRIEGNNIKFGIGDESKLGLGERLDEETTDCLKIIGTIINGIVGRYVLIFSEEIGQPVGRTGRAFLLTREDFDKRSKMFKWQQRPDWEFSNFEGIPDFFDLELDMDKYIKKAIKGLK